MRGAVDCRALPGRHAIGFRPLRRYCPVMREIILDTLGKLEEHDHGIGGYCLVCRRVFNTSLQ
jgi:hypothetical protein